MPIAERTGSGERTFVLVHGMPGAASQMAPLALPLASRGEVVLVDLPDSGGAPDDLSIDPDDAVADVRAIVESLAPARVTLVGLSFGAWLAARLASTAPPPNLERMALLGGYVRLVDRDVAPFEQLVAEIAAGRMTTQALFDIAVARWFPGGAPPDAAAHVSSLLSALPDGRCVRALHRLLGTHRPERAVGPCDVPAAVVHARGDAAVPLEAGEALAALLPCARLTVLDTDSHYLPWTHAEACVAAICG
jgi:pimeloyl-ACP methyl ester carboxylesterase